MPGRLFVFKAFHAGLYHRSGAASFRTVKLAVFCRVFKKEVVPDESIAIDLCNEVGCFRLSALTRMHACTPGVPPALVPSSPTDVSFGCIGVKN